MPMTATHSCSLHTPVWVSCSAVCIYESMEAPRTVMHWTGLHHACYSCEMGCRHPAPTAAASMPAFTGLSHGSRLVF